MLGLPAAEKERFVGMDLTEPTVDMVALAQSLGVAAERITEPAQLAERDKPVAPRRPATTV